jgi:hypothetical protein
VGGELIDKAVDRMIPGPTPDFNLGKEILKQNTRLKVDGTEKLIEHIYENNQN